MMKFRLYVGSDAPQVIIITASFLRSNLIRFHSAGYLYDGQTVGKSDHRADVRTDTDTQTDSRPKDHVILLVY